MGSGGQRLGSGFDLAGISATKTGLDGLGFEFGAVPFFQRQHRRVDSDAGQAGLCLSDMVRLSPTFVSFGSRSQCENVSRG